MAQVRSGQYRTRHRQGRDSVLAGVAHALLHRHGEQETLTRRQVLAATALDPVKPRLQLVVDDSFQPSGEWAEIAARIEAKHHVKHGLFGRWPESIYVKRYRHRSLGWSVVLARHVDLIHPTGKWWLVLDLSRTALLRRRVKQDARPDRGWQVLGEDGQPLCRGFPQRAQADHFAEMTAAAAERLGVPVLWLQAGRRYDHMPLFGVGQSAIWASPATTPDATAPHKP